MWDQNSNRKTRVEKGAQLAPDGPAKTLTEHGRRNVHGRREGKGGKPSLVRTGVNVIQDAGRGAADLIASRIPPGRVENPTNQESNRPRDQQTNRATNDATNQAKQVIEKHRKMGPRGVPELTQNGS